MATAREPWDSDSDSDFQSATSVDFDDAPGDDNDRSDDIDPRSSRDAREEPQTTTVEDFDECIRGLRLDDGYFGADSYRGSPSGWSSDVVVTTKRRVRAGGVVNTDSTHDLDLAVEVIGESDLERVIHENNGDAFSRRPSRSDFVRDAMVRAAADSLLRGVAGGDDDDDDENDETGFWGGAIRCMAGDTAAPAKRHAPVDTGEKPPPSDRQEMLLDLDGAGRPLLASDGAEFSSEKEPSTVQETSDGNESSDDDEAIKKTRVWEDDAGVAHKREREKATNRRRFVSDKERSSDDEETVESKRVALREQRLRELQSQVTEQHANAGRQFPPNAALGVSKEHVARSDREAFIAEDFGTSAEDFGNARFACSGVSSSRTGPDKGGGGGGAAGIRRDVGNHGDTVHDVVDREIVPGEMDVDRSETGGDQGGAGPKNGQSTHETGSPSDLQSHDENNRNKTSRGWRVASPENTDLAWQRALPRAVAAPERKQSEPRNNGGAAAADESPDVSRDDLTKNTKTKSPPVADEDTPDFRDIGLPVPPHTLTQLPARPTSAVSGRHPGTGSVWANSHGDRPKHRAAGGLGPLSRPGAARLANCPDAKRFPMHAAAFYGDLDALRVAIFDALSEPRGGGSSQEGCASNDTSNTSDPSDLEHDAHHPSLTKLDACGNTVAHVAVLVGNGAALDLLFDDQVCDFPIDTRNALGWSLVQEATRAQNKGLVRKLVLKKLARDKRDTLRKTQKMVFALKQVPDMTMQMRWEFGSSVFGPVVRAYAPSDTYDISKKGVCVRVDGTLRGIDEERDEKGASKGGLLPKWRRGAFSILFLGEGDNPNPKGENPNLSDASQRPEPPNPTPPAACMWYLDHEKKQAVDMSDESESSHQIDGFTETELVDAEVDALMKSGSVVKEKFVAGDISFKPSKTWLGGDRTETVGPWRARVWEASGTVAVTKVTRFGNFFLGGTFGEYLESHKNGTGDVGEPIGAGLVAETAQAAEETEETDTRRDDDTTLDDDDDADSASSTVSDEESPETTRKETAVTSAQQSQSPAPDLSPSGGNVGGGVVSKPLQKPLQKPLTSREARRARRDARREKAPPKPRKVSAKCWIADGFPVSVEVRAFPIHHTPPP